MTSRTNLLIDSHAHLDMKAFDADREEMIRRAWDAGLGAIVTIAVEEDLAGIERAASLAREHERVYATVGVHPHDAEKIQPHWYEEIRSLTRRPEVVGVGETGLDYHYMHSPREHQREAFERFLAMGMELDLPVVIHSREADEDTVSILSAAAGGTTGALRGVVHCFSGDYALARTYLDLGLSLSFNGILTFPKSGALREVVEKVPLERVLLETDSPYLTPVPHRGRRNEPARVVHVAETVAAVVGRPLEEVARVTTRNVLDLFGLPGFVDGA